MLVVLLTRGMCSAGRSSAIIQRRCYSSGGGKLERFDRWFQTKYPAVYKVHRTVVDGGKQCFSDLKTYYRVSTEMKKGRKLEEFSRHDLEVYVLTPTDIEKLVIIAVVIALPMTIFIMAVALVFFPRLLLTRHFWTLDQTEKFRSVILRQRRLVHYSKIAQYLVEEMGTTKKSGGGGSAAEKLEDLLKRPPITLDQLKTFGDVFRLIDLDKLPQRYQFHLSRSHGLWTWSGSLANRLRTHAQIIATLDERLRKEGVDNLSLKDMKQSLYLRQYDIVHLNDDEERQLLKDWLTLTKGNSSGPLVLHAPIISQLHLVIKK